MAYSIIIPSRNVQNLRACVAAIRQAGETARVIVVWDSTPVSYQGLVPAMNHYPPWEGCLGEAPFCFARNINLGIRAAGVDDVILLHDDALLETPHGFTAQLEYPPYDYGILSASTNF